MAYLNYVTFLIIITSLILMFFYIFLAFMAYKIWMLEKRIITIFKKRTWIIPSLFELTKNELNKHDEIFKDIIWYKKIEFSQINYDEKLINIIKNEQLIHNELNFIFKVCNKNKKLQKEAKFLYIKDLLVNQSYELSNFIKIYRKISKTYNKYIFIKNLTLIWLFIPIIKKDII